MGIRGKGCVTCRARRLKCDESQPLCKRCNKAGITCGGYPLTNRFVDERPRIERSRNILKTQEDELALLVRGQSRSQNSTFSILQTQSLLAKGAENDFYISFLASKLLEGRATFELAGITHCSRDTGIEPQLWTWELAKVQPSSKSLAALARMYFGECHGLNPLKWEAAATYGKALPDLSKALSRKANFSILATVTALCMYELLISRSNHGWEIHADGLSHLMQIGGPQLYVDKHYKSLLFEQRSILVSKAIITRQKIFLASKAWKSIPWADDPKSKRPIENLIDIICDMTTLYPDLANLAGGQVTSLSAVKSKVVQLFADLNSWWSGWISQNPKSATVVASDAKSRNLRTRDVKGALFPTILQFDNLSNAYAVILYDAVRILLLQASQKLSALTPFNTQELLIFHKQIEPNALLLGLSSDAKALAREILRSMDYCYVQSGKFIGTYSIFLSLDIANSCFEEDSREARWLSRNAPKNEGYDCTRLRLLPQCQLGGI